MPSVRASSRGRLIGRGRRAAVARRRAATSSRSIAVGGTVPARRRAASSATRRLDRPAGARPRAARRRRRVTAVAAPGRRSPTSRPACVPPVAVGTTSVVGRDARAAPSLVDELEAGEDLADRADRAAMPPTPMTYGRRPAARRSATTRSTQRLAFRAVVGRGLVDGRAEQLVEDDARVRRVGRRPGQDEVDAEPGPAPAAAVSRPWFDQRRPTVTSVSAPSASAAPTRNSRLRSLLPAERERQQVLALDPDARRRPPSAAEKRGEAVQRRRSVDQAKRGNRGRSGVQVGTRAMVRPRIIGRWPPGSPRPTASPRSASTPAWSARSRSPRRRSARVRLYSSIVSTAPGDQTRIHHHGDCETSIYILSGRGALHLRPDRPRARVRRRGGRLRLHPGRRDPRRGECLLDRAARRRPDAQLPRFARRVPRRRPGRRRRRPGAVLSARQRVTGWRTARSPTSSTSTA